MDKEKYYDEHIAPKLLAIGRECKDNGISMVAVCEWAPGETGATRTFQEGSGFGIRMVDAAEQAHGDVDSFMIAMERYAWEHGHVSFYLRMRGIPEKPSI